MRLRSPVRSILLALGAAVVAACAGPGADPSAERSAAASAGDAGEGDAGEPERVRIGGVEWLVDYEAAVRVARERELPLWVHFGENPG